MKSWVPNAIIYQVNFRSLAAREPRNAIEAASETPVSTTPLHYLAENLQVLQELGITVLHLMPPFPIGLEERKGIGSPYAVQDYLSISEEYGSLADLKALVRQAHQMEFKVILGMVPNHTSRDNVWVTSHPEFYVKDSEGRISFDLDWSDTAKLDYTNPGLRKAMADVCAYWLTFMDGDGVDGFRFDMAHFINDKSFWDDTLPALSAAHPERPFLFLAECYGRDNNLDLFARGMNAAYDDDFYKVCEYFYAVGEGGQSVIAPSQAIRESDNLHHLKNLYQARGLAGIVENTLRPYEDALGSDDLAPRLARYTDNHDEGRGLYRYGPGAVRAMNALSFMSPHAIPFLLTGQEFGALNRPSIHERAKPCDKGQRLVKGGVETTCEGVEFEGNIFDRGQAARTAWYAFYKELIQLRRSSPELVHGSFSRVDVGEDAPEPDRTVIAFDRTHQGKTVRCAINLGPEDRVLKQSGLFQGKSLYRKLDGEILPAFSAVAVRLPSSQS